MKPSMATRGGKCVKLTKLINYIMKKNRNKSLPGGLASKEPIDDENDDCFITIFVIHGSGSECHCEDEE